MTLAEAAAQVHDIYRRIVERSALNIDPAADVPYAELPPHLAVLKEFEDTVAQWYLDSVRQALVSVLDPPQPSRPPLPPLQPPRRESRRSARSHPPPPRRAPRPKPRPRRRRR